ncbi:DUF2180 family protein [Streptomyces mirabilis]|uniref:DUF2180 family protein n=1 Tax=Streptomyces mirabilis TaxID=68239 RepID=UPI0033AE0363
MDRRAPTRAVLTKERGEDMNCYDCPGTPGPAVAVCIRCGAGLCRKHVHESHPPTQDITGTGRATHEKPARHITCGSCRAAETS